MTGPAQTRRRPLLRPAVLRTADEDRHPTWLELFFDLCFVAAIAALAAYLHHHPTAEGLLWFVALFLPVWWAWMGYTWYASAFDNDDVVFRLSWLVAMLLIIALAAGVGSAADGHGDAFALTYGLLQALLALLFARAARKERAARRFAVRCAAGDAIGALLWFASLAVDAPERYLVWGAAMIVLLATPPFAVRGYAGKAFNAAHIAERYGLFTLIVLGESVVAVGASLADSGFDLWAGVHGRAGLRRRRGRRRRAPGRRGGPSWRAGERGGSPGALRRRGRLPAGHGGHPRHHHPGPGPHPGGPADRARGGGGAGRAGGFVAGAAHRRQPLRRHRRGRRPGDAGRGGRHRRRLTAARRLRDAPSPCRAAGRVHRGRGNGPSETRRNMDEHLIDQIVETAARLTAGGVVTPNGHGNISVRVPGADEMYFTSAPSLNGLGPEGIARVGLDGTLLEGDLQPIQAAVVAMHTSLYRDHPDVGCVVHAHPRYATVFAVANREIKCWVEAMAMFGLADGVPVAAYGPRGSDEAVANIRAAVRPGVPAVLLANHGLLVFHRTPELAVLVADVVEEAARVAIESQAIGGPQEVPAAMRAAALQRTMAFDAAGPQKA